ncbi:MAG: 3-hydroxyacyl-ACP dehydratase FabZ [Bacteroidota bacterium]
MAELMIEEIKNYLPHRYPFLLVDRVVEVEEDRIQAYKNVTVNEDFFNGHFPGQPIMPGVLQIEALAQAGAVLMMKQKVDNPDDYLIVFSGIKNAKFRKPVVPGDQLQLEVEMVSQRRNFVVMEGKATVDGNVTCELEASAAIVKKEDV